MKSTINIILKIGAVLLLCMFSVSVSFLAYYYYAGIDWGYPGGEISFVGLSKAEVAKILGDENSACNDTHGGRFHGGKN